jgi:pre-mRNA-splicing factor SYF2
MSERVESETPSAGSGKESLKDRLFNLRMKINQGRKANKEEVEEEYKRFSNPKHAQKQRYLEKVAEAQQAEAQEMVGDSVVTTKKWNKDEEQMKQTAEQAEYEAEKIQKKADTAATFGWQAFTAEATHRAYEKRLKNLPTHAGRSSSSGSSSKSRAGESHLEENPLDYGKSGAVVSKAGLDRLTKDIEDREEARSSFSKRRMKFEASDVDYINERNAAFNKKLKRSFDKYTVEIRQNLERGTAI